MRTEYTFHELIEITRTVAREFDAAEQRPWTIEAMMIELMKQVGDLSRRVMTMEGYYLPDRDRAPQYKTSVDNIADELADILYCVIRVAEHYGIDLEQAHLEARRKELKYLGSDLDI